MQCRKGCGACCIAPLIVQPIPGMPDGKPAGVACVNLEQAGMSCRIWGQDNYPVFCRDFQAEREFCGDSREQALHILAELEANTRP